MRLCRPSISAVAWLLLHVAFTKAAPPLVIKNGPECFVKSDYMEIGVHEVSQLFSRVLLINPSAAVPRLEIKNDRRMNSW